MKQFGSPLRRRSTTFSVDPWIGVNKALSTTASSTTVADIFDLVDKALGRNRESTIQNDIELGDFRVDVLNFVKDRDPAIGEELFQKLFHEVSPDRQIQPTEEPDPGCRRFGSDAISDRTIATRVLWDQAPEFFIDRISDPTYGYRAELLLAGSPAKGDEVRSLLLQLASDPVDSVRDAACDRLSEYPDAEVVTVLAGLTHDNVARVRWDALVSLKDASPQTAIDEAERLSRDPLLRAAALALIESCDKPECLPQLQSFVRSKDRELAVSACKGIGCVDDEAALQVLEEVIQKGAKDLRATAVSGLCNFEAEQVLPILRKLRLSRDPEIVRAASDAIAELTPRLDYLPP